MFNCSNVCVLFRCRISIAMVTRQSMNLGQNAVKTEIQRLSSDIVLKEKAAMKKDAEYKKAEAAHQAKEEKLSDDIRTANATIRERETLIQKLKSELSSNQARADATQSRLEDQVRYKLGCPK